ATHQRQSRRAHHPHGIDTHLFRCSPIEKGSRESGYPIPYSRFPTPDSLERTVRGLRSRDRGHFEDRRSDRLRRHAAHFLAILAGGHFLARLLGRGNWLTPPRTRAYAWGGRNDDRSARTGVATAVSIAAAAVAAAASVAAA